MQQSSSMTRLSPTGPEDRPSVAAVIPVFNSRETLGAALRSVFNQSVPCDEVVVVDDGSTDGVEELLRSAFPSVRLIRQQNSGAASARNNGVAATSADFVAFLDADDLWHPRKVELQRDILAAHRDAVACSTEAIVVSPETSDVAWDSNPTREVQLVGLAEVFSSPYLGTPTVMVRKSTFVGAGGFNTSLKTAEDIELWLRLAELGPICRAKASLAAIRPLSTGLSKRDNSGDRRNLAVIEAFLTRNQQFAVAHPRRVRRMKSEILCRIGSGCLVRGEKSEARTALLSAISLDPLNSRAWYLLTKSLPRPAIQAGR